MRRRRIETIEADNLEDYMEKWKIKGDKYEEQFPEENSLLKKYSDQETADDDYLFLSSDSNYILEKNKLSLSELEKIDEETLTKTING